MSEARTNEASIWPHVSVGRDLGRALAREWVVGNGAGAYASSTVACMHTRRRHGLLVAALDPPRGRHVVLSHVDVTVSVPPKPGTPREIWDLAKHQFPGIDPERGAFWLDRFDQDPLPRFTYAVAGGELEVALALVRGENAAVLRYTWRGPQPVVLTLRPLLAMRHMHALMREHGAMEQRVELRAGEMRVRPMKVLPRLCFKFEGTFVGSPDWWRRFEYLVERDRGLEFQEDLWTPGVFEIRPDPAGVPNFLLVGVDKLPEGKPEALFAAAENAIRGEDPGPDRPELERKLAVAAQIFRADLSPMPSIVSGYPWAEPQGRDALVALPGLYLATGKVERAMEVARAILSGMQDGLIASRLADESNGAETMSIDATLWLFEAARCFADALGDSHAFVQGELLPALTTSFETFLRGGPGAARVTADGLLAVGRPGEPVSAADAKAIGRKAPPHGGCVVEIAALWARACFTLARLAHAAGQGALADRADIACRRARAAFQARFWCDATSYPFDSIDESDASRKDASIRPFAVLALSVDPACFSQESARATLERARAELVTPAGLRTLAPSDAGYRGRFGGSMAEREAATDQGGAMPWLLGAYARAVKSCLPAEDPLALEIPALVLSASSNPIIVGQTPLVAAGDPPHAPNGCPAHALAVAELLRVVKGG